MHCVLKACYTYLLRKSITCVFLLVFNDLGKVTLVRFFQNFTAHFQVLISIICKSKRKKFNQNAHVSLFRDMHSYSRFNEKKVTSNLSFLQIVTSIVKYFTAKMKQKSFTSKQVFQPEGAQSATEGFICDKFDPLINHTDLILTFFVAAVGIHPIKLIFKQCSNMKLLGVKT